MSVELILQRHVAAQLATSPTVTALVAAANIGDEQGRPAAFPAIRFGEMATDPADLDLSFHDKVSFDVVGYSDKGGTGEAKAIAAAIRDALPVGFWRIDGLRYVRATIAHQHVTRDGDGVKAVVSYDVVAR